MGNQMVSWEKACIVLLCHHLHLGLLDNYSRHSDIQFGTKRYPSPHTHLEPFVVLTPLFTHEIDSTACPNTQFNFIVHPIYFAW